MKRTVGALPLAVLLAASPAIAGDLAADAAIVVAGQGADFVSTQYKLQQGHQELVGPAAMGGATGRAALKVALSAGVLVGCKELRKHGHKNQARLLAVLAGLAGAVPAIVNMQK